MLVAEQNSLVSCSIALKWQEVVTLVYSLVVTGKVFLAGPSKWAIFSQSKLFFPFLTLLVAMEHFYIQVRLCVVVCLFVFYNMQCLNYGWAVSAALNEGDTVPCALIHKELWWKLHKHEPAVRWCVVKSQTREEFGFAFHLVSLSQHSGVEGGIFLKPTYLHFVQSCTAVCQKIPVDSCPCLFCI